MCDNGKPCEHWQSPADVMRRKGMLPDRIELLRRVESVCPDAAAEACDEFFWDIIRHWWAKEEKAGANGIIRTTWTEHDQEDLKE